MKEKISGSVVSTLEQGSLLMNPVYKPLIKQLWLRPSSISELVEATGCTMNQAIYRIKQLSEAGLVKQVEVLARKGRGIKLYSMTNKKYIVPFSQTPNASIEEFLSQQLLDQQAKFSSYFTNHIMKYQEYPEEPYFFIGEEDGEIVMKINFEEEQDKDTCISIWLNARLDAAEVEQLQEEVQALMKKYDKKEGEDLYLMCFQLAPVYE